MLNYIRSRMKISGDRSQWWIWIHEEALVWGWDLVKSKSAEKYSGFPVQAVFKNRRDNTKYWAHQNGANSVFASYIRFILSFHVFSCQNMKKWGETRDFSTVQNAPPPPAWVGYNEQRKLGHTFVDNKKRIIQRLCVKRSNTGAWSSHISRMH